MIPARPVRPKSNIDRNTTLCLACSSSLPPLKALRSRDDARLNGIHITQCCDRPICPSCISSNPQLARYDPCLACFGGVGAANSLATPAPRSPISKVGTPITPNRNFNLDGAMRDEDAFVLGDDDDDEPSPIESNAPPPYDLQPAIPTPVTESSTTVRSASPTLPVTSTAPLEKGSEASATPCKYYLKRADTLMGICLRFGTDSHEICKLNNLPTSIMRTTPHLLHTRAFLLLPPNPKTLHYASMQANNTEEKVRIQRREENLVRERAEKRVQTLMKEVDWGVAKAYVALADDAEEQERRHSKIKEMGTSGRSMTLGKSNSVSSELEIAAVESFLDDDEWEAEQIRAGRRPEAISIGRSSDAANAWDRRNSNEKSWWSQRRSQR